VPGIGNDGDSYHENHAKVMKNLLIAFTILFVSEFMFTMSFAKESPQDDEIDALISRIGKNIESASQVTKMAQKMNAEMVEKKVEEKKELKEAVVVAEAKVEKMEEIQEVFVAKMVAAGIDTTMMVVDEGKNAGPIFDAFLEYQKNGGTEDFNWFRLYIYK
jgi:hypothetical protein